MNAWVRLRSLLVRGWAVIAVAAIVVPTAIDPPDFAHPPIRSDGIGYHAWTRAIVKREFGFCHYTPLVPVGALSARHPRNPKRCTNKYPPGLALLRFPVMAWFVQTANPDLVISDEEHEASLWTGAAALLIVCLFVLATCRRLDVRPLVANLVVLAAAFGTGLFHYATFDNSFTHVYSAALLAALLWLGVRAGQAGRVPSIVAVAFLTFFVTLVRPPNVVVLLAMLAAWLAWRVLPLPRAERLRAAARTAIPVLGGIAAAALVQAVYNRWSSGHWAVSSYGEEPLRLTYFNEPPVLLSYERGLFTWYPAVAVLLVAALATRRSRPLGYVAVGSVAALTVVYGSWHSWPLGAGFGHRGFVEVVPLIAVAGAYGLSQLRSRAAAPALALLAVCAFVTVELMLGYWDQTIPGAHTQSEQYWDHVAGSDSLLP